LQRRLGLDPQAGEALLTAAERYIDRSHDLYQSTSAINRAYSAQQKLQLLEGLWRVAHADQQLHKYEGHLIRRIADLLHVPHSGFIAAKPRSGGHDIRSRAGGSRASRVRAANRSQNAGAVLAAQSEVG
jgi:uncharacterized tellurite resistance protein B-like protein